METQNFDKIYNIKSTRFYIDDLYGPEDYDNLTEKESDWFGNTISEIKFNMTHNQPSTLHLYQPF